MLAETHLTAKLSFVFFFAWKKPHTVSGVRLS